MVESGDILSISPKPDEDEEQQDAAELESDGDKICSSADEPIIGK
jgi:hypothetical protein